MARYNLSRTGSSLKLQWHIVMQPPGISRSHYKSTTWTPQLDTNPDNNSARDVFDVSYTDHVSTSPVYIHRVQDAVELKGQIVLPNIGQMVVTQDPGFVWDSVGFMASRHLEWTRQAFVIVHGQGWDDGV